VDHRDLRDRRSRLTGGRDSEHTRYIAKKESPTLSLRRCNRQIHRRNRNLARAGPISRMRVRGYRIASFFFNYLHNFSRVGTKIAIQIRYESGCLLTYSFIANACRKSLIHPRTCVSLPISCMLFVTYRDSADKGDALSDRIMHPQARAVSTKICRMTLRFDNILTRWIVAR
jgi:hypothetical protein